LWFNAGVELGQIAIVVAALGLVRATARWTSSRRAKLAVAYLAGCTAACWFIDRAAPIVTAWW
jgi:hypothetical protein